MPLVGALVVKEFQTWLRGRLTFAAFTLQLPDTSLTVPVNVCFAVTVKNQFGASVLGSGYSCVQPSSSAYWCGASTCDFDSYNPGTAGLPPRVHSRRA